MGIVTSRCASRNIDVVVACTAVCDKLHGHWKLADKLGIETTGDLDVPLVSLFCCLLCGCGSSLIAYLCALIASIDGEYVTEVLCIELLEEIFTCTLGVLVNLGFPAHSVRSSQDRCIAFHEPSTLPTRPVSSMTAPRQWGRCRGQ